MFTPPKLDKERQDVIDKIISSEQEYIAQLSYLEKVNQKEKSHILVLYFFCETLFEQGM